MNVELWLVRGAGLEPAHHCWRQDLNLVRLPISPPARGQFKPQERALASDASLRTPRKAREFKATLNRERRGCVDNAQRER